MKRVLVLLLCLSLLSFLPALAEGMSESDGLREENEFLKAENERLRALIDAYADPSVIVAFEGGCVRFEEVYTYYTEVMGYYRELYESLGMEYEEDPGEALELQQLLAVNLSDTQLLSNYFAEKGIVLMTEEERNAVVADAEAYFVSVEAEAKEYFLSESEDEAEADALTQEYLIENGLDRETLVTDALNEAESLAAKKALVGEVTLSEEEIRSAYELAVESAREYYGLYPEEYGFDCMYSDTPIAYVPEGYRRVRMVVIPFDDADMAAYDELYIENNTQGPEADALFDKLMPEAMAVYERLEAGESFDAIREEYPNTEYYMDELGSAEGFVLCQSSATFEEDVTNEIMALIRVGAVTQPLRNDWGFAIYQYLGEVESGEVPFETIRDGLAENTLTQKEDELYEQMLEQLRQDKHLIYFFDRLN